MSFFQDVMGDMLGFGEYSKSQKAYEIADQWRREFYEVDSQMTKTLRAIKIHPESYVMGFSIPPNAYYEHEIRRAKYEMGLDLQRLLNSRKPCKILAAFQRLSAIEAAVKRPKRYTHKQGGARITFGRGAYGIL